MCDTCSKFKCIHYNSVYDLKNGMVSKCKNVVNSSFREVILYNLLNHPNIPKISNLFITNQNQEKYIHFQMKKLVPLDEYYIQIKTNTVKKWKIFRELVSVVMYLGCRGLYHQNICPDNVLIDTETDTPYLIDYEFCGHSYTVRRSWTDPLISECYYQTFDTPSKEMMMEGDIFSLGLLGVWLFIDSNIYQWTYGYDDETPEFTYLVKDRFGSGLRNNNFKLDNIDEYKLRLLDRMMGTNTKDRIIAMAEIYKVTENELNAWDDPIDINGLNKMTEDNMMKKVIDLYGLNCCLDNNDNCLDNMNKYIDMNKTTPIESYVEAVKIIKDILSMVENEPKTENKVKLVCFLYDHIIPRCYDYINNSKFWRVVIDKLEELKLENKHILDLYLRNIDDLKTVLGRYQ